MRSWISLEVWVYFLSSHCGTLFIGITGFGGVADHHPIISYKYDSTDGK